MVTSPDNNGERAGSMPAWFRETEHTADAGIEVTAEDLSTLFERAAWGMFTLLCDIESVQALEEEEIRLKANDREDLLVRWLSELNYLHHTRNFLYVRFNIREITDQHLVATVYGEPYDPSRHVIHTEIKAVTFHGMEIRAQDSGWFVRVIFDL